MTRNKTTHEFRENSLLLKKVNRNFLGKYFCSLQNAVGSSNSTEAELNVLCKVPTTLTIWMRYLYVESKIEAGRFDFCRSTDCAYTSGSDNNGQRIG